MSDTKRLKALAALWKRQARKLHRESNAAWEGLRVGKLPQDDEIIYSVYQKAAAADCLDGCAREILKVIKPSRQGRAAKT